MMVLKKSRLVYVQDNDNQGCKCPDGFEGAGTNTSGCVGTLIRTIGTWTQDYQAYAPGW